MSPHDEIDLIVLARSALLDALAALHDHLDSIVVIGAQAIYLHTAAAHVPVAATTKDSDLALDVRTLRPDPRIEEAMRTAGFERDTTSPQPGTWLRDDAIPIDLMVPETLAGPNARDRRGARIPPHAKYAARRADGIEATLVDFAPMRIASLDRSDRRMCLANVAGPASLLVAKIHKLAERRDDPSRLLDKDAHDVYRLLVAIPTSTLASDLLRLQADPFSRDVTTRAVWVFEELFASGPDALGPVMVGRAEDLVGDSTAAAEGCAVLARDLLDAIVAAAVAGE